MPYRDSEDWRVALQNKWLLFDADAIISILHYDSEELLSVLDEISQGFVYIHPVQLELMNTDNPKAKLLRTKMLNDYKFDLLPLTSAETKLATRIQESLPLGCQPSSTDFYLGGTLAKYQEGIAVLLTANTKDFPMPVYKRNTFINLYNDKSVKALTAITIDQTKLIDR